MKSLIPKTKKKLCFVLAPFLISSTLSASGIPVVDVGSLTQAVQNYAQMGKQYAQQLKEYQELINTNLNMKKHLEELGIGMTLKEVLGESRKLIEQTENLYDGAKINEDVFTETADITNACNFLMEKSPEFKKKINEMANTQIQNKVSSCVASTADLTEITQTKQRLFAEIEKIRKENETASKPNTKDIDKLGHEIKMIDQAINVLKDRKLSQQSNKMLAIYDLYLEGDETNPYSKKKLDNDLMALAKQLGKENNTKQSQALMNSILLKILEMNQRQYELNLNFMAMSANTMGPKGTAIDSKNPSYQDKEVKSEVKVEDMDQFKKLFDGSPMLYDEFGNPDFDAMASRAMQKQTNNN